VSKSTYASLYSVVGPNAFGTDTSSDFYLPNLQGRVPVGVSTTDADFDRGDVGGAKTHTLSVGEIPSHTHLAGYHNVEQQEVALSGGQLSNVPTTFQFDFTGPTGGNGAHNNMQPYLSLNYIVKT